jgi:hypothetical protein
VKLIGILFLSLIASCVPGKTTVITTTSAGSGDPNAPSKWALTVFPLDVYISPDFSQTEADAIIDMGEEWEDSIANQINFFDFSYGGIVDKGNTTNLNSLGSDSIYAIYKSTAWNEDLPISALAVTQIFGIRKNIGTVNEYVKIIHADILMNYEGYTFTTVINGPGYDFQSVVLHEMGHFLGLDHSTNVGHNSVMYPSISSIDVYREVLAFDTNTVETRYGLNGSGAMTAFGMSKHGEELENDKEEPVRIIHEMHPNGLCKHKKNGVLVEQHRSNDFKKL